MSLDVARLRARVRRDGIDRASLDPDPLAQFAQWHDDWKATQPLDPSAVVLATASAGRGPSARWMRLASIDTGFVLFTDARSEKAGELDGSRRAGLCFGWLELARQVRARCEVHRLADAELDRRFEALPRPAQVLAWASDQHSSIPDRERICAELSAIDARFGTSRVPRCPHWRGYRLVPDEIEFWQGRADGVHDRIRYRRARIDAAWEVDRVAP